MKSIKRFETFSCAVHFLRESYGYTLHDATHYVWDNGYKIPGDNYVQLPIPQ